MSVVVVGLNHRTCPVEVREKFALADDVIPSMLTRLRDLGLAEEGVLLSTCNRVELYVSTPRDKAPATGNLEAFFAGLAGVEDVGEGVLYTLEEPGSVQHLFRVASGLDSMVLGETEILGQMKKAYDLALRHQLTGPGLNRAFQKAFNTAKYIRTETLIQRGNISVASVAVDLAGKIFSALKGRHVMVIGAGDTSEKTARALVSRGATDVVVSNRSLDKAEALAADLGGRAVAFDAWEQEFDRIDIVISSTSAPHYVLDRPHLERLMHRRRRRELLLIDIAVPRDIDPDVNALEDVFLYNVDDLQAIAEDCLEQRQKEVERCNQIIRERAEALLNSHAGRHHERR